MNFAHNQVVLKVEEIHHGKPIREFLKSMDISDRALKKLRNKGKILCNGYEATWRKAVATGDEVVLFYPAPPDNPYLKPEPLSLEILYEDQDMALVNKPPGLCVHPTLAHPSGTLANGLLYHWSQERQQASFHPVHRIDRNTSGLVLVAKNSFSAQKIFLQRQQKKLSRSYIALVHGSFRDLPSCVDLPMEKCEGKTTKRQISGEGQRAVTYIKVLEHFPTCTMIRLMPETGRTHQIRVHLAHLGHPLVGDQLYGGPMAQIKRHCLHADQISFLHPRTSQALSFQIPLPEDMVRVLDASL
ncbi:RluA family pseudouridine synthase [Desulforamulus ruminis]|uniref:RluA family pseudouridine synthase n=1 Tax=Desulforamulus ruminis TaxID=1564 RepID=UPI00059E68B3|nr:RluA family pseudouridine synthase [Desulforamulus ruminis]